MTTHYVVIYFFIACLACASPNYHSWPFSTTANVFNDIFEDNTNKMKSFFEEQKNRVESAINSGFEEVIRVKDSVNNYIGDQQRRVSDGFNNYIDNVKQNSKNVMNSWSFLPIDDPASYLEDPEAVLSVPSMLLRNGYPCETHTINSKGYLLNIHRIPHSQSSNEVSAKTVILQHGLLACSADWVLNGPGKALAYVLADQGYDVWLLNARGNKYSREHAWLKTDSKAYWNFSWHDMAMYDVPKVIDYIVNKKGSDITYIGHSMGTTILFAMLSLRPEYNNILKAGIALAPEVFLTDVKSPLKALAPIASNVAYMEMMYGMHEFNPRTSSMSNMFSTCGGDHLNTVVCKNVMFYICGTDEAQFNKTLLPGFLANFGVGTSWKTVLHFAQEIQADGKFQQFDYGVYNNKQFYGSNEPPEYDLSRVTLPLTLVWAKNDLLSSEKDVKKLYGKLPPQTTEMYMVPHPEFNHLDYLWAVDAPTLLNQKLIEILERNKVARFSLSINLSNNI